MAMSLFKYIAFDSYWDFPLRESKLHFSSIEELRSVNDQEEFNHQWDHPSYFFTRYGSHYSESYDRLFGNSRVLCMGKNLNRTCWDTFISNGAGVCYDFTFNESSKASDISCGHITYDDSKNLNVPSYLLSKMEPSPIKDILLKGTRLDYSELREIATWHKEDKSLRANFEKHIHQELTLKKTRSYRLEKEFRFIHLIDSIGLIQLHTPLVDSKMSFENLGLRLNRIFTSDIEKVEAAATGLSLDIRKPNFL